MEEKKIEELNGFKDLRIVDNFYQTSSFFPMPTTEIGTLSESGQTNLGSYSLCFPYYIAGKDYYAMVLCCRNSSNTAKNILRTPGEIEIPVKMLVTCARTERPHGALLQLDTGIRYCMYRIGGRLRSDDASCHGADVGIPPLQYWVSNLRP